MKNAQTGIEMLLLFSVTILVVALVIIALIGVVNFGKGGLFNSTGVEDQTINAVRGSGLGTVLSPDTNGGESGGLGSGSSGSNSGSGRSGEPPLSDSDKLFFVALDGNDSNPGTISAPFATHLAGSECSGRV